MRRLTAVDAQFLYGEELIPAAHLCTKVAHLDSCKVGSQCEWIVLIRWWCGADLVP